MLVFQQPQEELAIVHRHLNHLFKMSGLGTGKNHNSQLSIINNETDR
jgi:hypothetical protein